LRHSSLTAAPTQVRAAFARPGERFRDERRLPFERGRPPRRD